FAASDSLVAYRIPEYAFDIDGNGIRGDLIRARNFDPVRNFTFGTPGGVVRQEVAGNLLGFAEALSPTGPPDGLFFYYARFSTGPEPVTDATHSLFAVNRTPGVPLLNLPGRPSLPIDFAVTDEPVPRIAFIAPEADQGEDLTGDGDQNDLSL